MGARTIQAKTAPHADHGKSTDCLGRVVEDDHVQIADCSAKRAPMKSAGAKMLPEPPLE